MAAPTGCTVISNVKRLSRLASASTAGSLSILLRRPFKSFSSAKRVKMAMRGRNVWLESE
jgi:hypothetical protein